MSHHILCVDELGLIRAELLEMLKRFDVKISSVKNEVEALSYLHAPKEKVDALVWSINTIGLKGLESIRSIKSKAIYKDLPVIIVSKFTDRKYVIKAIEAGACEYIAKPYDEALAAKKLCNAIGMAYEGNKGLHHNEELVMFSLEEMLTREIKAASRGRHPLSIMLVSVALKAASDSPMDNSNEIVDLLNKVLRIKLRDTDTVFSYGDGKLMVLLPFADKEGTPAVSKKVMEAFENHTMIKNKRHEYDLTISSVTYPDDGKIKEKLLEKLE